MIDSLVRVSRRFNESIQSDIQPQLFLETLTLLNIMKPNIPNKQTFLLTELIHSKLSSSDSISQTLQLSFSKFTQATSLLSVLHLYLVFY